MTQFLEKADRTAGGVDGRVNGKLLGRGLLITTFLLAAALSGCMNKFASPPAPPPPAASVAHPLEKEVVEWDTFCGYLQSPEMANVAARVSGLVLQMPFTEGSMVKRGDLLAVIDDRPFKADLDAKLADQQKAESTLALAKITFDRMVVLRKKSAVAEQDFDNAKAACDQAAAILAGAKAAVATSKLNLEWCLVRSPIDGRVSNKLVTEGNLVTGGGGPAPATLLTTVTSVSPMYVYVDVDETTVQKYRRLSEERKLISAREGKVPCYFELGSETGFPHEGVIDFMDNHVDKNTGTMKIRAVLDNKSGQFIDGYFARLRVPGSGRYRTLLVPDEAVGNDQNQTTVNVVGKDNMVQVRQVQLGALFGRLRSIKSGISTSDLVIVNGQARTRPGVPVTPTEVPIKLDEGDFTDPGAAVARRDVPVDTKARDGGKGNDVKGDSPVLARTRTETAPVIPAYSTQPAVGTGK
jgi:RND family efflux transporter MFP subunit